MAVDRTLDDYDLVGSLLMALGQGSFPRELWQDAAVNHYVHAPLERIRRTLVGWALALQGNKVPFRAIDWLAHRSVILALVQQLEESALRYASGYPPEPATPGMPPHWPAYSCDDYLFSTFAQQGYWDTGAQLWVIEPVLGVRDDAEAGFLQVGRPGVDDIGFGYRQRKPGFWAVYRGAEPGFRALATSIHEFVDAWNQGKIEL
jgi:hypothetical protein